MRKNTWSIIRSIIKNTRSIVTTTFRAVKYFKITSKLLASSYFSIFHDVPLQTLATPELFKKFIKNVRTKFAQRWPKDKCCNRLGNNIRNWDSAILFKGAWSSINTKQYLKWKSVPRPLSITHSCIARLSLKEPHMDSSRVVIISPWLHGKQMVSWFHLSYTDYGTQLSIIDACPRRQATALPLLWNYCHELCFLYVSGES